MENLKKNWLVVWKMTGVWQNFIKHSKISKIFTLMSCFWPKYKIFELKKVQRSYVWWHWILIQNFKKNWLVLSKLPWGIWQIFTRACSKVLGPFIQSTKCMDFEFTGEWCVMTMKSNSKFEEDLTCRFKIDRRNLMIFDSSTQKSQ